MVIVDSSVWVEYFRAHSNPATDWLQREVDRQRLGITDLILCEVLQGTGSHADYVATRDELLTLEVFETGGLAHALAAASNYRALRQRGHTVRKTIDCLIATFCLRHGHSLLHNDHDYDPFEQVLGLSVVHPHA